MAANFFIYFENNFLYKRIKEYKSIYIKDEKSEYFFTRLSYING